VRSHKGSVEDHVEELTNPAYADSTSMSDASMGTDGAGVWRIAAECAKWESVSVGGALKWYEGTLNMQFMTFNLRFENDRDGEKGWHYRRELVVEVIRESSPLVLGTQEGTEGQLAYLRDHLPQYQMQASGRLWDGRCQYPTLFYRADRLHLLEGGEFWLSMTPTVHRSKDWGSAFPRMMNYGLMEDLESQHSFWIVVTHLDHIGAEARLQQTTIIAEWFSQRAGPRILMGDFNDVPDSSVHAALTSPETGLGDTWQALLRRENEASMTHHNFLGVPQQCRMDWILVSREFRVVDAVIVRSNREGLYPSDHFPYLALLEWEKIIDPRSHTKKIRRQHH
jgi:endonuclease/exonuclease/phosphatase family metal-dependent hydrolase